MPDPPGNPAPARSVPSGGGADVEQMRTISLRAIEFLTHSIHGRDQSIVLSCYVLGVFYNSRKNKTKNEALSLQVPQGLLFPLFPSQHRCCLQEAAFALCTETQCGRPRPPHITTAFTHSKF